MMDIDHFKEINDRFGHAAGDDALRQVAAALQKNKRDYDFPGRWGGEEFLIIVPGASLAQAAVVAERVRASVEMVELQGTGAGELRSSLGVTAASPALRPIGFEELVQQADDAMYLAKATGRNRVCLHSALAAT
jgi:two-component system cell cycle response regulator